MPTYEVTDPQTGQKLRLTGDSPPTEQELTQIFSQQGQPRTRTEQVMRRVGGPLTGLRERQRTANQGFRRQAGLAGRALVEGAADIFEPITAPLTAGLNLIPGVNVQSVPESATAALTSAGVPEPRPGLESGVNVASRFLTGIVGGGAVTNVATRAAGIVPRLRPPAPSGAIASTRQPPPGAPTPRTPSPRLDALEQEAVDILDANNIPLSRAQRSGSVLAQRIETGTRDQPFTADRAADFGRRQVKAFTSAVLRRIGAEGDAATPQVMGQAKTRIGNVFDRIAEKNGALFDNEFSTAIDDIMREAGDALKPSELKLLQNSIDRLVKASIGEAINGQVFNRVRSAFGNLSKRSDVGQFARQLSDTMLDSLQRASPGDAKSLELARSQWRSLQIIAGAIEKGLGGQISPLRLSSSLGTKANRAASVFGQGGDQELIRLAKAGRDIIPESLPQSGTIPRGLVQAPIRSILTAPLFKGAQSAILRDPSRIPSPPSRISPFGPLGVGPVNALRDQ